jgi:hypothetical protein
MATRRSIHAKISLSESVEAMSEWAQLLWDRVIVHADDHGVGEASPAKLKGKLKPLSPRPPLDFATALAEMAEQQMLVIYASNDRLFYQISNFEEHQEGLHKRTKPSMPLCCDGVQLLPHEYIEAVSGKFREIPGNSGLTCARGNEEKRNETKGSEVNCASGDARQAFDHRAWFEKAWAAYPHKRGKHDAERHFQKQVKSDERAEAFLMAVENYKAECLAANRLFKDGSTFFNRAWEEYVTGVYEPQHQLPRLTIAKVSDQASLVGAHLVQPDADKVYAALSAFESTHGSRPGRGRPEERERWDAMFEERHGFHPDELVGATDDDFARWARTIRRSA